MQSSKSSLQHHFYGTQKFILPQRRTTWCFGQTNMKEWCDHQSYIESHCTTILVLTFGNVLLLCCKEGEEGVAKVNGVWRLNGTDSWDFYCRTYTKTISSLAFPSNLQIFISYHDVRREEMNCFIVYEDNITLLGLKSNKILQHVYTSL